MSVSAPGHTSQHRTTAIIILTTLVVLAFIAWWMIGRHSATPRVIEGWAMPNAAGTAISLHETPDAEAGTGYIVAGAHWTGPDNVGHQGHHLPTCIGDDPASFTHVELGVVTVKNRDGSSWPQVVWVRCLE